MEKVVDHFFSLPNGAYSTLFLYQTRKSCQGFHFSPIFTRFSILLQNFFHLLIARYRFDQLNLFWKGVVILDLNTFCKAWEFIFKIHSDEVEIMSHLGISSVSQIY